MHVMPACRLRSRPGHGRTLMSRLLALTTAPPPAAAAAAAGADAAAAPAAAPVGVTQTTARGPGTPNDRATGCDEGGAAWAGPAAASTGVTTMNARAPGSPNERMASCASRARPHACSASRGRGTAEGRCRPVVGGRALRRVAGRPGGRGLGVRTPRPPFPPSPCLPCPEALWAAGGQPALPACTDGQVVKAGGAQPSGSPPLQASPRPLACTCTCYHPPASPPAAARSPPWPRSPQTCGCQARPGQGGGARTSSSRQRAGPGRAVQVCCTQSQIRYVRASALLLLVPAAGRRQGISTGIGLSYCQVIW